ncbi:MAG TPA: hypothetical protein VFL80_08430 [Thermoanaerobaculia bacterium]|nr:hypothetical protein [Thermoanaerobaculia bacterium]
MSFVLLKACAADERERYPWPRNETILGNHLLKAADVFLRHLARDFP